MNKLLLVRHGQSVGNVQGIIQGKSNYPLTDLGKIEVKKLLEENEKQFRGYDSIVCSPQKRAHQTAQIISKELNKPLETTPLLEEVGAGILENIKKNDAINLYPEFYKIWKRRGDLDKIISAEKGDELQARVLMFLDKYIQSEDKEIVVSHAAFLRSLINTVYSRNRETQVSLEHNNIYTLENVWGNISIKECYIAKSARVFEIETYDKKYIMKRINDRPIHSIEEEKKLLDYLSEKINTPKVLGISEGKEYNLKLMNYAPGLNIHEELNQHQINNTVTELYKLKLALEKYSYVKKYQVCNILKELENLLYQTEEEDIKNIILNILSNEKFINGLNQDKIILVHDDLHRDNILYEDNTPIFLDFDGIMLAPATYQLASHIAINYLLYNCDFNINKVINIWPESIEVEYLKGLILFRTLKGYNYFKNRIAKGAFNDDDYELKTKYRKVLSKMS